MADKRILIVGYGNIGRHMYRELERLSPSIYDRHIPEYTSAINDYYDFAFICVPTDMLPDGSADISIVEEVVALVSADIIVIKSAVPVGTTDSLAEKYKKNIIVSPEYYGTTQHSSESPNFLILGGDIRHSRKVAQLYYTIKSGSFRIKFSDTKTAELAKYMENSFLALKVTFCSEFKTIADSFGIVYEELRELFIMDERMGDSHTFVYDNQPYYDSHCMNKDIPALIKFANNPPLMSKMAEINQTHRRNKQ